MKSETVVLSQDLVKKLQILRDHFPQFSEMSDDQIISALTMESADRKLEDLPINNGTICDFPVLKSEGGGE